MVDEDDCAVLGVAMLSDDLDANVQVLGNTNLAGRAIDFREVVPHVLASETGAGRDLGGHSAWDGLWSCEESNSASDHGCDTDVEGGAPHIPRDDY